MEDTVKQRLSSYIRYKGMSNSQFCKAIGVSSAYISSMRQSISNDKTQSIALNFPDLNITWLLTGEGEMLDYTADTDIVATERQERGTDAMDVINRLVEINAQKDEELRKLRTAYEHLARCFEKLAGDNPASIKTAKSV